ncbi:hypothetical protein [Pontibacter anaerobius]|uniref:Toprim domain-containing protein n=1 Tax=Pontibacter anaerobius TaxID=2993940 RepID=A0ABT3RCC0_9BACT|nr:hypothetical protein [Pontibacter anaerobius]MCX2739499.1 hypothetical protein [Pontibacter anaerobius]
MNRWYDHGTGEGGKVFDLALRLHRTATIREVIQVLSEQFFPSTATNINVIHPRKNSVPRESPMVEQGCSTGIKVLDIKPLEDESQLANYLRLRGISIKAAKLYCQEVRFSIGTRQYKAVGFENRSGGYELRNDWFKGSSSPKDVTFVDEGAGTLCLLEGFMDFLSLLELRPHLKLRSSFLVLNSLSQLGKSLEVLGQHSKVLLFLAGLPRGGSLGGLYLSP